MKKLLICLITLLGSTLIYAQANQKSIDAPNIDFSMGDFTNWKRYFGKFICDNPTAPDTDKTYSYFDWTEVTTPTERIKLTGDVRTLDPILQCDDLQTNPDPGKNVARIGEPLKTEGMIGAGCNLSHKAAAAEKLEYTYTVTPSTTILKYRFAAVLHIPDKVGSAHIGDERPFFDVNIKVVKPDGTKATVACSSYSAVVNQHSSLLKRGNVPSTGCTASKGNPDEYMFQPWTDALVDLREYVGSKVTISVITHDCLVRCTGNEPAAGGHEAYGYFRAEVMDLDLSTMVCNTEDASIAAPEGFASYQWSRSDHYTISANPSTPNIVSIESANMVPNVVYSCTLSDQLGCAAVKLSTKLDPVVLEPSFDYTAKCGGEVEFTSTSTVSGDEMVNWIWDAGEGQSSGQISNHTYSAPGDYDVTLTATTKNGCKQSYTKIITVPYFPDLKVVADPNICSGRELNVLAENVEYGSKIEWSSTEAGQTFPEETSFITNPTKSQIYTAKVTDSRGCEYTASKEVIVFGKTHVYISGADITCPSEEILLTLVGNNLDNISWNAPNSAGQNTIKVYPTDNAIYTARATDINGCEVTATHTIGVHPRPTLTVDSPIVCKGTDATVKVSGAQSYFWHDTSYSGNTGGELVINNVQNDYSVLVTGYNEHGCTNSTVVSVKVKDKPVVSVEGDTERCFDTEPFKLVAHGADTYIWNNTEEAAIFSAPSDRDHTITVVGKIGTCESEPLKVNLITIPVPKINALQEDVTICTGDEVALQVNGADTYQWYNTTETSNTLVVAPLNTKTYTVRGVSANGCTSDELDILVTVNHPDLIKLHIEKSIACPGKPDSAIIVANGALTYQWSSIPEREDITYNQSDVLSLTYDTPTLIKVKGTNEFACNASAEISLTPLPEPVFDFKVEPTYVEEDKPDVRVLGISPAEGFSQWYWDMGDGSDIISNHDTIYTYDVHTRTEPFLVEVTAIDENGCRFTGETEIEIWKQPWAPDAFSPNFDGLNDNFHLFRTKDIEECYFYIYNRLGEVVFEGYSVDDTWDGTYKGKPCPWGTYGWVLQYTSNINGEKREEVLKGQVTLVR